MLSWTPCVLILLLLLSSWESRSQMGFNYFDKGRRKSCESTYSWGCKEQIVLKNWLKLIISFIILLTVATGNGLLHLHQTPNRKFFCFPVNCGCCFLSGDWLEGFFLPLSLIDRSFFVWLFVIGQINFVFKQLFTDGKSCLLRGPVAVATQWSPAASALKSCHLSWKLLHFSQTVWRRSTFLTHLTCDTLQPPINYNNSSMHP